MNMILMVITIWGTIWTETYPSGVCLEMRDQLNKREGFVASCRIPSISSVDA